MRHRNISNAETEHATCRVGPLYQHVFSPTHPTLSFLGLVWQVIPFPLMELQAKWVARVLAGRSHLPSRCALRHSNMSSLIVNIKLELIILVRREAACPPAASPNNDIIPKTLPNVPHARLWAVSASYRIDSPSIRQSPHEGDIKHTTQSPMDSSQAFFYSADAFAPVSSSVHSLPSHFLFGFGTFVWT